MCNIIYHICDIFFSVKSLQSKGLKVKESIDLKKLNGIIFLVHTLYNTVQKYRKCPVPGEVQCKIAEMGPLCNIFKVE